MLLTTNVQLCSLWCFLWISSRKSTISLSLNVKRLAFPRVSVILFLIIATFWNLTFTIASWFWQNRTSLGLLNMHQDALNFGSIYHNHRAVIDRTATSFQVFIDRSCRSKKNFLQHYSNLSVFGLCYIEGSNETEKIPRLIFSLAKKLNRFYPLLAYAEINLN